MNQNPRPVKYNKIWNEAKAREEVLDIRLGEPQYFDGQFHGWKEAIVDGLKTQFAIVESDRGEVVLVSPTALKFLDT